MSEAIIELKDIKKQYGKHEVLKGVNMQINRGDIYGLIGRNGAGKTTIFKMILGLSEITDGTVSIAGSQTRAELYKNRNKIGFMVGSRFFNYLSARENLKYIALSSMILYITNNIPVTTISLLLLYIAVPFSALLFSLNPQVKALHIERLHYAGLADNAFSDFLFGSVTMGIAKLFLGLLIYLGLVLFVTIKIFDKKELEF